MYGLDRTKERHTGVLLNVFPLLFVSHTEHREGSVQTNFFWAFERERERERVS